MSSAFQVGFILLLQRTCTNQVFMDKKKSPFKSGSIELSSFWKQIYRSFNNLRGSCWSVNREQEQEQPQAGSEPPPLSAAAAVGNVLSRINIEWSDPIMEVKRESSYYRSRPEKSCIFWLESASPTAALKALSPWWHCGGSIGRVSLSYCRFVCYLRVAVEWCGE